MEGTLNIVLCSLFVIQVCPPTNDSPSSYSGGVVAGLKELAPHLIGVDPRQLGFVNDLMDYNLKGHAYVKSALDVACWDVFGKVCECYSILTIYINQSMKS